MSIKSRIRELVKKAVAPNTYNQEAYHDYLRKHHVVVGEHTVFYSPARTSIDVNKPWLIKIGDYCKITQGVTILAHDYSIAVPRKVYGEFRGGSLPVTIGDNVFIGVNSTILMGTTIGDNSIVGANSVVKGTFEPGVVIAGNPATVVCTIEDYYNKLGAKWASNAKRCAQAIQRNSGHKPTIDEMSDGYAWLYLPRTEDSLSLHPDWFTLTADDPSAIQSDFLKSTPKYSSFEAFLDEVDFDDESN